MEPVSPVLAGYEDQEKVAAEAQPQNQSSREDCPSTVYWPRVAERTPVLDARLSLASVRGGTIASMLQRPETNARR